MPQRAFVGNSYSGCDDASFPAPAARRPHATAEQLTVVLLSCITGGSWGQLSLQNQGLMAEAAGALAAQGQGPAS